MKIGERIRYRREQLEMSQDELAKKLGYKSRSSIAKIENDASGLPQQKIIAIANVLHTTPAYIMGWETNPKKRQPDDFELSTDELLWLELFRQIPDEKKDTVIQMLQGLLHQE